MNRYRVITYFNETFIGKNTAIRTDSVLQNLAYNETDYTNKQSNPYLDEAIHTLMTTDWKDMYGLNLSETMDLDYATFKRMKKKLAEFKSLAKAAEEEMLRDPKHKGK